MVLLLIDFPDEILLEILKYISFDKLDFGNLRKTCNVFRILSLDKCFKHLIVCGYCNRFNVFANGHLPCLQLVYKTELNATFSLRNYVVYAKSFCRSDIVEFLINNGSDIHQDDDTSLITASLHGCEKVVRILVNNGANIHAQDNQALVSASSRGYTKIVEFLVENGAAVDDLYNSPICWACKNGHIEVVKYLLDKGVEIKKQRKYALGWAAYKGHLEIVKMLTGQSIDPELKKRGVKLAWNNKHFDVVKYLINKCSDIRKIDNNTH